MYFDNKWVLLTGAARGIGLATLKELVARGARVLAIDIQTDELQTAVAHLLTRGATIEVLQADIGSDISVSALSDRILKRYGAPDMVINNAFARKWAPGSLDAKGLENFTQSFNINVLGFIRLHQAFLPHMISRDSGHVVDTASSLSIVPVESTQRMLPYITSKGAIMGLAYGMRYGLHNTGVRYSVFCPGLTDTRPKNATTLSDPGVEVAPPEYAANVLLDGMERGDFLISSEPDYKRRIVQLAEHQLDPLIFR
jgi:NAD(P)-dependent dehydrogenase (short-subunit alcohol dehydrogenase family)